MRVRALGGRTQAALAADEGSSPIELAVSLQATMLLLYCFMQVCLAYYSIDLVSELARVGTRYAMYHGASCPNSSNPTCEATASQVNTYVEGYYQNGEGTNLPNIACRPITVNTTYAAAGSSSYAAGNSEAPGGSVKVTVTCALAIAVPLAPQHSLTFSSTSVMPIVQ
jgi:hypothetical protein